MRYLMELSVSDLFTRTVNAFPTTQRRQHITDTVSVQDIELAPAESALIAKAKVRGTEGDEYDCVIEFQEVEYSPSENENSTTFPVNGKEYTIVPINRHNARAKVGCNCLDFSFRFSYHDNTHKALHGDKPYLYTRVPGSNRPPANPTQSPGMCKHVISLADELADAGIIQ